MIEVGGNSLPLEGAINITVCPEDNTKTIVHYSNKPDLLVNMPAMEIISALMMAKSLGVDIEAMAKPKP